MTIKTRISDTELAPQSGVPSLATPSATANAASGRNILFSFWRHRWWIVLSTIVGVAGGYLYMKRQVRVFQSYSNIYIQENSPGVMGGGIDTQTGIATQCEVIRGTSLLTTVAERPDVKDLGFIKTSPSPVNAIKGGLGVMPGSAPNLVTIVFQSTNPVEAARMVNAIVDAYVEFTGKEKKSTAEAVLELLRTEKITLEAELSTKQQALKKFKEEHGTYSFTDDHGNIILQRLGRLSEMLTNAHFEKLKAQWDFESVTALQKDNAGQLLARARREMAAPPPDASSHFDFSADRDRQIDPRLLQTSNAFRDEIEKAERELAILKLNLTPEHIRVKESEQMLQFMRSQLAEKDKRIADERARILAQERHDADTASRERTAAEVEKQHEADRQLVESFVGMIKDRYGKLDKEETELESALAKQREEALELNLTAAEYSKLESESRQAFTLYETLANRIQTINVNEHTSKPVNVSILEVAHPNYSPIRPDKPRIMGMGLILGLAIGCALAFGLDVMDERFHSAEEVMAALDVPLLGIIPHIADKEQIKLRGRHVALEPMSDVAEAYRTIRTAIYFAIRNQGAKRLLVTSPAPGDGKTTTTTNIAIAMAQAGRRVLLIDADFRKPTVHKIFQLSGEVGVTSIMLGEVSRERAIHPSGIENLDVLPCGPLPSNPAEILNGQAFLDLLEGLDRMYDHIIIDSPPVVPVTDARILGALCDDTILVLRAEKSTRRLSEHACESLLSVGTRILGVVVNDVPRRRDGYGYYYGYGSGYRYYQYGYGSGSTKKKLAVKTVSAEIGQPLAADTVDMTDVPALATDAADTTSRLKV